jgi:hypothetical protein
VPLVVLVAGKREDDAAPQRFRMPRRGRDFIEQARQLRYIALIEVFPCHFQRAYLAVCRRRHRVCLDSTTQTGARRERAPAARPPLCNERYS